MARERKSEEGTIYRAPTTNAKTAPGRGNDVARRQSGMMGILGVAMLLSLQGAAGGAQAKPSGGAAEVVGTWEGESKCTVPDSPCKDEHVIYEIAEDEKAPGRLTMKADKVVNGERQYMGTVNCEYHADKKNLSCSGQTRHKDDWEYTICGDTMTGTLKIGEEKTLYRKISVKKKSGH